jgi:hypothetical protein
LLDALESGQIPPAVLNERLAKVDQEREELTAKRQALEWARSAERPVPAADMFKIVRCLL